jgi:hypothetical protein
VKNPSVNPAPIPAATGSTGKKLLGAAVMAAALLAPAAAQAEDESKVNFLVNFEFANSYLTPRGMLVQNQGLVFQPLLLGFAHLYKGESFVKGIDGVGGVWNCFGSSPLAASGPAGSTTCWYEIDPIAGISVAFDKGFKLDVTYTAFNMQIFNLGTSQHLETKVSFDDSPYLKQFSIHPYVSYWRELSGKAVANTDPVAQSSYYFDLGMAPSYTFEKYSVKLEAPCRILMADSKFYGTGAGNSSTVGLYEVGLKASVPMKFMPMGYGNWGFHAGYKYMGFCDNNLKATQGVANTWQVYCGISTFF